MTFTEKLMAWGGFAALAASTMPVSAAMRPAPDYLKGAVVYQIALRNFTREGDFRAAERMLGHIRSLGVDVVYLTPFVEMDRDMAWSGWSPRQRSGGYHTPKNPYRISDYDKVDPEYGGDADFQSFNDRAHALGMKVYMDLVYLHCGPNNVLKEKFPDAFQRNADGTVRTTQWNWPYVNFESKGVRKYLIDSMLRWMRLGCDGFRRDVGDQVPIDFWVEAVKTCQAVKPDLVMINEGTKVEWLEKAFDACYAWPWSFTIRHAINPKATTTCGHVKKGAKLSESMRRVREYEAKVPAGTYMFCFMDNHDTAPDDHENRFDRILPVEAGNVGFVLNFLRRGIALVFNGNEIADRAENSMFGAVEDIARAWRCVDWSRALQPDGQRRLALIRRLAELRHTVRALQDGSQEWLEISAPDSVIAFARRLQDDSAVCVYGNVKDEPVEFELPSGADGTELLSYSVTRKGTSVRFGPWGYLALKR